MSRAAEIACAVVIVALSTMGWLANHYHGKYQQEQKRADTAEHSLKLANATITDMQVRQRDVAALDAKYTGELADAKETIERLHSDVIAGRKRLQLNARCTANGATATSGMGDASGPRLNDTAQRDYFTLRERITIITGQVNYLQNYIRTQCLK
ncbi:lysis protein [Klebsiella oxytoca]|jgi:prophage endopeptidase|uniref:Lysis protein n=1 Tax=Klebsiella oxytoca TaxID=571 RepID=A0AAP2BIY4_KLEOX|nr:lysis protein [Klebsiella oxytoca]ELV3609313.1 lysis protein [Klebsiella oxytoca]MBQ0601249.1 lysis protein [Klebsiella oxytoca]SAQ49191.1 bacteriophage lysis protein [Klebsiella oxytoca]HBN5448899.1 lysis protein [Klebsiella oxytoca]HBU7486506.1 lysis protein [Klebsiella oxytoca]